MNTRPSQRQKSYYLVDSFIDNVNKTHHFVVCGVLTESIVTPGQYPLEVLKHLAIGVSISKPDVEFEDALGKNIAYNRAIKPKSRIGELVSSNINMLTEKMILAIIQNEVNYIKENPVKFMQMLGRKKANYKPVPEDEILTEIEAEHEFNN